VAWQDVPDILAFARTGRADRPRVLVTGSRTWADTITSRDHLAQAAGRHPGVILVHGDATSQVRRGGFGHASPESPGWTGTRLAAAHETARRRQPRSNDQRR
jgi:SLOG family YspA-like protein